MKHIAIFALIAIMILPTGFGKMKPAIKRCVKAGWTVEQCNLKALPRGAGPILTVSA